MSLRCSCPNCGKSYRVGEEQAGRTATCRQCGTDFDVPPAEETIQAPEVERTIAPLESKRSPLKLKHVGRFEIREKVGLGAFGAVYRAHDPLLDREVALKVPHANRVLDEKDRARMMREAKASAQLFHPNIVPVFDAGTEGDRFFIASAFIEGESLQAQLEKKEFSSTDSARIVMQLALAHEYAHHQGIVHRDVKPGNVMLTKIGEPKLMDFGLARLEEAETQLTQEGAIMGTPAFMAPEQAKGSHEEVGPVSDQYSLGVILYRLICGQTPFSGPVSSVIYQVVNEEPPPPSSLRSDIPMDLETICLKAMSKRPADRYPNCGSLAVDLRRWLDGDPILARPLGPMERFSRWYRKNPVLAVMAATTAVALLTVAVVASAAYMQTSKALAAAETERGRAESALEQEKVARQEADQARERARKALENAEAERGRAEQALKQEEAARKEADVERQRAEEALKQVEAERSRAREQESMVEAERKRAETALSARQSQEQSREYYRSIAKAHQECLGGNYGTAHATLHACPKNVRQWEWGYQESPMSGLTVAGTIGGTVPFMPPEQITHYRYATPQADQYSTAATLYYLLTGKYLFDFEKESADRRLKCVLFEEPVPLQSRRPEIPAGLAAAVHQALSKSQEARFPGVAAFREAIAPFANRR